MVARRARAFACARACACVALAAGYTGAQTPPLPLKFSGPPTTTAITAADLMKRLYIFADDSMLGRLAGDVGFMRATAYIEREVRAMGLTPGGDDGGFFQKIAWGTKGIPVDLLHRLARTAFTAPRNVIAILPGSDDKLRGEYIVIGAHSDHVGFEKHPVDHDSVRVFNDILRPQGAESSPPQRVLSSTLRVIRQLTDSLHKAHPARRDSIYNGADDDGSGSVALLELAEAFAGAAMKPHRSIIFIWHGGEEEGMLGSEYFTDHPTVPRNSIVAEFNMDMIGRGASGDVTGRSMDGHFRIGGPGYLQLIGSRRLSTELGDLIEAVNVEKRIGLAFDYAMDADRHPARIYCRSDHASYARFGIPIAFFTTGSHADYHELTDEPQYIDYERMEQVAHLVYESVMKVANLDHRLIVDRPVPKGACRQ